MVADKRQEIVSSNSSRCSWLHIWSQAHSVWGRNLTRDSTAVQNIEIEKMIQSGWHRGHSRWPQQRMWTSDRPRWSAEIGSAGNAYRSNTTAPSDERTLQWSENKVRSRQVRSRPCRIRSRSCTFRSRSCMIRSRSCMVRSQSCMVRFRFCRPSNMPVLLGHGLAGLGCVLILVCGIRSQLDLSLRPNSIEKFRIFIILICLQPNLINI